MVYGILDTQYIDLPAGLDAAYIEGLRNRAGVSFAQVLTEIDRRMATLNGAIDALAAALLAPPTTELFVDGTAATAFNVERRSEYTVARPQMVEGQATMLPLYHHDVSLEFTEDGLEAMSLRAILTNVDSAALGFRRRYRLDALRRLFSIAEERFDPKTAAAAPGFAGSGSGTNAFTRPYPDGTATAVGYSLYYRDTQANLATVLKTARNELKKWQAGPFDLIANSTQIDAIAALPTDFVSAGSNLIRPAAGTAEALVDSATYVGVYDKDIRVRVAPLEIQSDHIALFKTNGAFATGNPLVWRYDELKGRAAYVRSRSMYPLDMAVMMQSYGIGCNNRVGAALIKIAASGGYSGATIAAA